MNLQIGYMLPTNKHTQFQIYVSVLKHFGLKEYSFTEFIKSGLDVQHYFWNYDENRMLINEYNLFREWLKYPDKYDNNNDVKSLIDKYNIFDGCDLKEKAHHLHTYLLYFDKKGFDACFKERIKSNIEWFF